MWLLHKNYAVTTKLSNAASIVLKCPKDTSAPVPTCRRVLGPKFGRSEVSWVRSVLGPKCLYTKRPAGRKTTYTTRKHQCTRLVISRCIFIWFFTEHFVRVCSHFSVDFNDVMYVQWCPFLRYQYCELHSCFSCQQQKPETNKMTCIE